VRQQFAEAPRHTEHLDNKAARKEPRRRHAILYPKPSPAKGNKRQILSTSSDEVARAGDL
jgi:hypothetical protein